MLTAEHCLTFEMTQ